MSAKDSTAGYRYVLSGSVRASPLDETSTSYGLGMAGVLLWVLPIPMHKTSASVTVDLVLTDTASGSVIWRDTITSGLSRTVTLYGTSAMIYGSGGPFSFNLVPRRRTPKSISARSSRGTSKRCAAP